MKVHCLFEQSGTFKNEFKKLGYEAYDYDLQNEFGETDHVIDLFEIDQQIDRQRSNKNSLVSILNWDKYQIFDQQIDQQATNKRPTSDHKQE